jgi:hypothetical protein
LSALLFKVSGHRQLTSATHLPPQQTITDQVRGKKWRINTFHGEAAHCIGDDEAMMEEIPNLSRVGMRTKSEGMRIRRGR